MKKIFIAVWTGALLLVLAGCGLLAPSSSMAPSTSSIAPSADGLIHVIIPADLLGGQSAQEAASNANDPSVKDLWTEFIANKDGSVTWIVNQQQYETLRENTFNYGHVENLSGMENSSIINTVYHDNMMKDITIYVNKQKYNQSASDRMAANQYCVIYAGEFQMLCGVAPDDWHVTITVEDDKTHAVISKKDFPNDTMYDAGAY